MGRHSSGKRITLAAARELALSAERYRQRRSAIMQTIDLITVKMTTVKFSTNNSDSLFVMPTIAIEQNGPDLAIHFIFWHRVFNVEIA